MSDGRRTRSRASGDSQALLIEGRRDALEIVTGARRTADAIVAEAESAEAKIQARMRALRRVIQRTGGLLGVLAESDPVDLRPSAPVVGEEPEASSLVGVPGERARTERRSGAAATAHREDVPEWLRHLLDQLRARGT